MSLSVIFDEEYYQTKSALEDAREWMPEELEQEELEGGRYTEEALLNRARQMRDRYLDGVLDYLDEFLEETSDFRNPNPCARNSLIVKDTTTPAKIGIYSDILQLVNFPPFTARHPYSVGGAGEYWISKIYDEDGDLHIKGGIPGKNTEVIVRQLTDSGEATLRTNGMSLESVWKDPALCKKLEYAGFARREYGEYSEMAVPSYAEMEADSPSDAYRFDYMLLDRLAEDCRYYINICTNFGEPLPPLEERRHGPGQYVLCDPVDSQRVLWAGNVERQIAKMRELYNHVPEKPEWLAKEDIDAFEETMVGLRDKTLDPERLMQLADGHNDEVQGHESR